MRLANSPVFLLTARVSDYVKKLPDQGQVSPSFGFDVLHYVQSVMELQWNSATP